MNHQDNYDEIGIKLTWAQRLVLLHLEGEVSTLMPFPENPGLSLSCLKKRELISSYAPYELTRKGKLVADRVKRRYHGKEQLFQKPQPPTSETSTPSSSISDQELKAWMNRMEEKIDTLMQRARSPHVFKTSGDNQSTSTRRK